MHNNTRTHVQNEASIYKGLQDKSGHTVHEELWCTFKKYHSETFFSVIDPFVKMKMD